MPEREEVLEVDGAGAEALGAGALDAVEDGIAEAAAGVPEPLTLRPSPPVPDPGGSGCIEAGNTREWCFGWRSLQTASRISCRSYT